MRFCPTGGIDAANAPAYLALPNVACVGGSWMCKGEDVEALAAQAASLARRRAPLARDDRDRGRHRLGMQVPAAE
jgi:2-dehydro-3-deoxyphosphogluconate aldolase/(4S)-4-hydroxy-2-oxoglutarate aldolase